MAAYKGLNLQFEYAIPMTSDFLFVNHGSIHILAPLTEAAKEWVAVNLPEDAQYFGKGVAIEPRYSQNILDGIADEGLTVA